MGKIDSFVKIRTMVVNAMMEVYKSRNKDKKVSYTDVYERFEIMFMSKKGRKRLVELATYYKKETKNPVVKTIMENVVILISVVEKKL